MNYYFFMYNFFIYNDIMIEAKTLDK